jgi:hypothetical protein
MFLSMFACASNLLDVCFHGKMLPAENNRGAITLTLTITLTDPHPHPAAGVRVHFRRPPDVSVPLRDVASVRCAPLWFFPFEILHTVATLEPNSNRELSPTPNADTTLIPI